ncbi:hypothetical protein EW146_g6390 [Bondarzewia mesenterica]|uniref:ABM domain-containing protein n=1 Tax=Bondarzewia mesenterica TaxID=1095465 RepID=A0A4S4LQK4_9AGAM|nr:hypothetical protein EW146_g6390 [Bondarzewia mesenterica]
MRTITLCEISWFTSSNEYQQDPCAANRGLALLSSANGMHGNYRGSYVEEPSTVVMINGSHALRIDASSSNCVETTHMKPGNQIPRMKCLPFLPCTMHSVKRSSRASRTNVRQPVYNSRHSTSGALVAPTTEFAFISLKEGATREVLDMLVGTLQAELSKAPGSFGSAWGWPGELERERMCVGVIGWDSIDAHWEAVSAAPLSTIIKQIKQIADVELRHSHLTKYVKY